MGIGATAVLMVKASATCALPHPRKAANGPENTLKAYIEPVQSITKTDAKRYIHRAFFIALVFQEMHATLCWRASKTGESSPVSRPSEAAKHCQAEERRPQYGRFAVASARA